MLTRYPESDGVLSAGLLTRYLDAACAPESPLSRGALPISCASSFASIAAAAGPPSWPMLRVRTQQRAMVSAASCALPCTPALYPVLANVLVGGKAAQLASACSADFSW